MSRPAHRRLRVFRGAPDETATQARRWLAGAPEDDVAWVGARADGGRFPAIPRARALMGRGVFAAVVDGHGGLTADALGQVHGCVRGGGALVLRLDSGPPMDLFHRRLDDALARTRAVDGPAPAHRPPATVGTAEQARVVDRLFEVLNGPPGSMASLIADRGRGKSAALGLAVARLPPRARPLEVLLLGVAHASSEGFVAFAPDDHLLARFFFVTDPDGYEIEVLQRHGHYQ